MTDREKLIELLKLSPACICDLCGEKGRIDEVAGIIADQLIANGVTVSEGTLPVADGVTERSAVVDKIEEKRKPEDFIGYRKPEQEWISVKDRLPDAWVDVLSCDKNKILTVDCVDEKGKWYSEYMDLEEVTHWMPLPEPPKGE